MSLYKVEVEHDKVFNDNCGYVSTGDVRLRIEFWVGTKHPDFLVDLPRGLSFDEVGDKFIELGKLIKEKANVEQKSKKVS